MRFNGIFQIPDHPNMSFAASCVSAFFYAFLRLKLLQKEHFLNFQKSVLFEAVLNVKKLQKSARLETYGNVWKRQITITAGPPNLNLFKFTIIAVSERITKCLRTQTKVQVRSFMLFSV